MSFDREIFYIEEEKLSQALELTQRKFDEKCEQLIDSSDDRIRLQEWVHYIIQGTVNKQIIRIFSREGAIAIAKYLDMEGKVNTNSLNKVFSLFEEYRINQIDTIVRRSVYENSSSLVVKRQRHWLNIEDVVNIFKSNKYRIREAFNSIQVSDDPMIINVDFENIEQAMRYVKTRDGCCQITGIARNKYENKLVELVGHHLYDRNNHKFLADDIDNIMTITEQIHDDFHQWNGGYQKSCTIDDFIQYVEWRYPQKHKEILMLENRRRVLLVKLTQFQRALPEGN
ncbi:hypothetical protein IQ231_16075 [Cuspidothrix issatschenkoi LEGE 03284]|uniref:hypothetical protein n=1 Tax=Cuspidothrix issatschenkoi TaxID=230752 RepID=UPI0018810405|nr:hypothetical protein [Cuspidothrix issatschenkoi]MBE9233150.1 hypothetical protein [Cuspidothrix issatschenkoi LEGE 03284]